MQSDDFKHLERCLELAKEAGARKEVPVGALLVDNQSGKVLAEASNRREELQSPLGHAETLVIHKFSKAQNSWRLTGVTLYTSLEPCVMCCGVILQARIERVLFSASDEKGGGQSLFGLLNSQKTNHRVDWSKGPLAEESRQLLQSFFKDRRTKTHPKT